jgi:hypothetical protein
VVFPGKGVLVAEETGHLPQAVIDKHRERRRLQKVFQLAMAAKIGRRLFDACGFQFQAPRDGADGASISTVP